LRATCALWRIVVAGLPASEARADSKRARAARHVLAAGCCAGALMAVIATAVAGAGTPPPRCAAGALTLRAGATVVPKTMELPLLLELVNHSSATCTLDGYPRVQLRSASGTLYGYSYRDSGDLEVTAHKPALVSVSPGHGAWVLLNKTPCIGNVDGRLVHRVWLMAPGTDGYLRLTLGNVVFFDYCGAGDPGHTIDVSPVEPSAAATASPH
jgi:Protein of unknown function (DUF4232)